MLVTVVHTYQVLVSRKYQDHITLILFDLCFTCLLRSHTLLRLFHELAVARVLVGN